MVDEYESSEKILRLPLTVPTVPRNANSLEKDPLLQNAYLDGSQSGVQYVVKRPGFYVGSEAITSGLNRGIYVNPNNVSGGVQDNVEVWYITNIGGLDSFNTSNIPPEEPFIDFSFNLVIDNAAISGASGLAFGYGIETGNDFVIGHYSVVYDTGVPINSTFYLQSTDEESSVSDDILPDGTYLIEIKNELGNYNLYKDSVLYLTIPVTITDFSPGSLDSQFQPPEVIVTDLQYI